MINSRKIDDLHPEVRSRCQAFIDHCAAVGIDVLVTSTFRDNESQAAIYAQGRTSPGRKVTNAQPGHSFHNYRLAFDFVPIVGGKAVWDDDALFKRCGEIGENCGLEWAGRWKSFPEYPHMQYTNGLTIADLLAGEHLG